MKEFSKKVIIAFAVVWFIAAAWAMTLVTLQTFIGGGMFPDIAGVLIYVGAPMTAGLVGYFIKAGAENVKRIEQKPQETQKYHV